MAIDKLGLEFTASLPETADAFNAAMDDYMLFAGEPVGRLLETAEVDPDFAMGYCFTGCLRLFGVVWGRPIPASVSNCARPEHGGVAYCRANRLILTPLIRRPPENSPKLAGCGTTSCKNIPTI